MNQESGVGDFIAQQLWEQQILTCLDSNADRNMAILAGIILRIRDYSNAHFERGSDGRLRSKGVIA